VQKLVRWGVVLAVVGLVLFRLPDVRMIRVAADDRSTPEAGPGRRLLVVPFDPAEIAEQVESLFLAAYPWDGELSLRLVRLVGVPGEEVRRRGDEVFVDGRLLPVPASRIEHWPGRVPRGECLVLTDQPFVAAPGRLHPDSRILGPVPLEQLVYRVVTVLPF
jgi:hypothetical protein